MRKFTAIATAAALTALLAGCGKQEPAATATEAASADASAAAATAAAAPTLRTGSFEVFAADGKSEGKTTVNADGTYRDVPPKGLPVAGLVKIVDGKTCFDPSGDKGPTCYVEGAIGADGSFTATADDGTVLTVKPVAAAK